MYFWGRRSPLLAFSVIWAQEYEDISPQLDIIALLGFTVVQPNLERDLGLMEI
ncbi:MAG: hypothetical protein MGF17_04905 [Trichodesmium sp. MAG_R04]|nr:hypothetical protein [Trichodesmium sp. MAG_R04]